MATGSRPSPRSKLNALRRSPLFPIVVLGAGLLVRLLLPRRAKWVASAVSAAGTLALPGKRSIATRRP